MKSYFNKYHNHSHIYNILKPTKNEKKVFNSIAKIIKISVLIVCELYKGIFTVANYIKKMVTNTYTLEKIGYSLNELLDNIYEYTPRQFEIFCSELFKQSGYQVELTPPTADYGRDIILNGNIFVECKHFNKNGYVGREIAMKLLGSCATFNVEKAIIITTGQFHKNAYEIASMVDYLELLNINDIQKMILDLEPEQISKIIMRTMNAS